MLADPRTWRRKAALGTLNVQAGERRGQAVSGGEVYSDGLDRVRPPDDQEVPDSLEALLEAYYRSVAQRRESAGD